MTMPSIPLAKSVAPSDTSTSVVIGGSGPQIRCGKMQLTSPPFLLLHGSADQLVSPSQTVMLHNALRARGVESTRYVIMGANHGDLTFLGFDPNVAKPWSSEYVMHGIVSFLSKHLG